ncbi:hypothetical protein DFJ58DRAFT_667555, partial [Suillus subalutaceus]|uniref:uncharacterized protein n=1 Tax=Suillus subalutaceus TaxID=48586 RepID=UPI001B880145
FSMPLKRVRGKSDVLGWWWFPLSSDSQSTLNIHILSRCKEEKKKFSSNYVCEMEGI